jgi:hypothetical protein
MTYEYLKAFGADMYTEGGVFDVASPHDDGLVATPHDDMTTAQVLPPARISNLQHVPSTLSTPEAPPVLFTNGNGNGNGNGAAVQPVQQAGMIPVRMSWTGVAVLGMAGAFFWWFWKRFLPGMHAVAERDRMRTAAGE